MSRISRLFVAFAAVLLVATNAGADDVCFSDSGTADWMDANNWEDTAGDPFGALPGTDDLAAVGTYYNDGAVAVLGDNTTVDIAGLEIGNYGNGTLTIEAGSTINSSGWNWVGYSGGDYDPTLHATLNVAGKLNMTGPMGMNIAGEMNATVTISGTMSSTQSYVLVGHEYHMKTDQAYEYDVLLDGGTISVGTNFYMQGMFENANFEMRGGLITSSGQNGYTGYSFWHMGGTFDVSANGTIDNDAAGNGPAIFAEGNFKGYDVPVLKFSGTDTVLTVTGAVDFLSPEHPGNTDPAVLDVSGLTVTPGVWTTVLAAGSITNGGELAFNAATSADANWELRIDGSDVQVKYGSAPVIPGDANLDGYVDDDDLSLLLSSWGQVADWANGEFSGIDPVNDDDLSILLTNWHVGTPPAAAGELIPEPATMVLLGLGGIALIRKRR